MTFNPANPTAAKRARSAFTLVECLAAMLFLIIVIPVALQGLRVASTAGEMAQRKATAARIGTKVLNELKVTGQLQNTSQAGVVQEGGLTYRWAVKCQSWTEDTQSQMSMATLTITYGIKGKDYDVRLSTLLPPPNPL
jgi:type II secretory pathway pseudopilin PulG